MIAEWLDIRERTIYNWPLLVIDEVEIGLRDTTGLLEFDVGVGECGEAEW